MARHIVISNGDDALTAPIVEYLELNYGIEKQDIRRVSLVSEVGDVQLLTVTLMVRAPRLTARDVDPLGRGVGGAPAPSGCPGCPGPGVPHQHYATGGLDALHAEQERQAARGDEVMPRPWSAIVADDDAWKSDDASAR